MYLINYVFGEAKIDCLNEVSKNVRVLGILTSQIADKTISIAAKMLLSLDSATQRILEYRKKMPLKGGIS